jgi:hypothetical protein
MAFDSLANIPDARKLAEWVDENGDGTRWGRYVRGTRPAAAGVAVTLCGWQDASGTVERHAAVSAADVELDAAALRRLAILALDAADELESLRTNPHSRAALAALDVPTAPNVRRCARGAKTAVVRRHPQTISIWLFRLGRQRRRVRIGSGNGRACPIPNRKRAQRR